MFLRNVLFFVGFIFYTAIYAGEVVTAKLQVKTLFGNAPGKHVIYTDGPRLRMDGYIKGKLTSSTIIDASREEMITLDVKSKRYTRITAAQFRKFTKQAADSMRQLQAQMSPQQRKAFSKFSKGLADQVTAGALSVEYKLVKKGVKVGKFSCDRYHGMKNGRKINSFCVLRRSWFNSTSRTLSRVQKTQMRAYNVFGSNNEIVKQLGLERIAQSKILKAGYPIVSHSDTLFGKSKMTVTNVESKNLEASIFEPPRGYRETKSEQLASASRRYPRET